MKKLYILVFFMAAFAVKCKAQSDTPAQHNKAIYVEVLGNGVGISANYDMSFKRGVQDGFGFRAGIGGIRNKEMHGGNHVIG